MKSGRIGKKHSTIWNCERIRGDSARSAHEALPQTPSGGKPPETPGPFPSDLIVGTARDPSRVRKPRQKRAPLTDPSQSGIRSRRRGKGAPWSGSRGCAPPWIGPEEWVQTREGEILLDKTDLLMEDAKTQRKAPKKPPVFFAGFLCGLVSLRDNLFF